MRPIRFLHGRQAMAMALSTCERSHTHAVNLCPSLSIARTGLSYEHNGQTIYQISLSCTAELRTAPMKHGPSLLLLVQSTALYLRISKDPVMQRLF